MMNTLKLGIILLLSGLIAMPIGSVNAEEEPAMIQRSEIDELKAAIKALENRVKQAEESAEESAEWKNPDSLTHLAGYAAVGYTDVENGTGTFSQATFNPIFHYQYQDKVLLETELELEVEEDGETEIALDYLTVDWMFHNNATRIVGKFLSPLGNFRQNLHPAWINRLASAPPGFGHDGAAPLADVGLQIRGGFVGGSNTRFTYAAYIANGPELEAEGGELHGIESEGFTRDADGEKVLGGRFSVLPFGNLEIGISAATADIAVVFDDDMELAGDPSRSYEVLGADLYYRFTKAWSIRSEFIQQDIGDQSLSVAPLGG